MYNINILNAIILINEVSIWLMMIMKAIKEKNK